MLWFKNYKKAFNESNEVNKILMEQNKSVLKELQRVKDEKVNIDRTPAIAILMKQSWGMDIDFSLADRKKCLPPDFMDDLGESERKEFVSEISNIHLNSKFQTIVRYYLNLYAYNMVYKEDDKEKTRNQGAVVGFRTLLQKMEELNDEHVKNQLPEEDFDDQALLPE